jgi:hypothetical protein
VATVLQREAALGEAGHPAQQLEVARGGCRKRALGELAPELVDRDQRVGSLVQIGANDHHIPVILLIRG